MHSQSNGGRKMKEICGRIEELNQKTRTHIVPLTKAQNLCISRGKKDLEIVAANATTEKN